MNRYIFKYREERTRSGEVIYRPVATVYLKGREGWFQFDPYVDSGADTSLFAKGDCELLGLSLKKGKEQLIGGISGTLLRVYIHKIVMRIGEEEFGCEVGFADIEEIPRLLGRKEIFTRFYIGFNEEKRIVEFIPK